MLEEKMRIALLHGGGYVGSELIRWLAQHPHVSLDVVTSRSAPGEPVWKVHPMLRGQTDLHFSAQLEDAGDFDALFVAAEHGQSAEAIATVLASGFEGAIVDLSADFRFQDPAIYPKWFGFTHPAPELLDQFVYGLPEIAGPYPVDTRYVANPGCFATGLALALWPVSRHLESLDASVTAFTGASGSGTRAKEGTHFPTRDGNVRAYKVLAHQHLPEVVQLLGDEHRVAFVPVSGPWTRGIWGTVHVQLPDGIMADDIAGWFLKAYGSAPFVRVWPQELPELRYSVNTPFCDIGWVVRDGRLVIGFGLDNLLKGAASQAIHNLNLILGLPETSGLLPSDQVTQTAF
jgi:LysW-gamma-L-alpha-aminoadipyl-6-phosphate/LysW-L-glutamyl-5-phosphate reductase